MVRINKDNALQVARAHMLRMADGIVREEFTGAGWEIDECPIVSDDGYLTDGAISQRAQLPPVALGAAYDWEPLRQQCRDWIADERVGGML